MAQTAHQFSHEIRRTAHLGYLLHVPPNPISERLPLILFLHGAGERGNDLQKVKIHGIPKVVEANPAFPFITISPQCPEGTSWPLLVDELAALVGEVERDQPVDPSRRYLTGLSIGGYGSWALGSARPEMWAAMVPICGGGSWLFGFPERVVSLAGTPVWAFHGAKDNVVPLRESSILVERLQKAGGNAKLTVYPEADHDSWTQTYADPELYRWLLEQRKGCAV